MMNTIKKNSRRGRFFEELINKVVEGEHIKTRTKCFDIETKASLIEVKSAKLMTITAKKKNGENYMRVGRFVINEVSHNKLGQVAEEKEKIPYYVFVVYTKKTDPVVVKKKILLHCEVDKILKKLKFWTRHDGTRYVGVDHTKIFGG